MKKLLQLAGVFIVLIFLITGCSKNPMTGNYGPSWDLTMRLPVEGGTYTMGDMVEAEDFQQFGYEIIDASSDDVNFFIVGTEEKPISKEIQAALPPLSINFPEALISIDPQEVPVAAGSTETVSIDIPLSKEFDSIEFSSKNDNGVNDIAVTVDNTGLSQLDELTVGLVDSSDEKLDEVLFANLADGTGDTKYLDLSSKTLSSGDLKIEVSCNQQSSGSTAAAISLSGLSEIEAEEVNGMPASVNQDIELNTQLSFGDATTIESSEGTNPRLRLSFGVLENSGLDLEVDSVSLDGAAFTPETDNSFVLDSGSSISFNSDFSIEGSLSSDATINYSSDDKLNITADAVGEINFDLPDLDLEIEEDTETGQVHFIYETEPMEVEISEEDLNEIRNNYLKEGYLTTIIGNDLPVDILADIYLANDKSNLYTETNKVNDNSIIEINSETSSENKFILDQVLEDYQQKLENPPVYMGIRFKLGGDTNPDPFTASQQLDIKSYIGLELKVNQ